MEKEVIRKAKQEYIKAMETKEQLLALKQALFKNIENPLAKSYLRVIEREECKIPNEEEILKHSFYNQITDDSTCNIYVFIGAYCHNSKKGDIQVSDYTKASYFVYQNLETMFSGIIIYSQEYIQFEKDNIVLRFNHVKNVKDIIERFYKLQYIYFKEYLNNEDLSEEKMLTKLKENL